MKILYFGHDATDYTVQKRLRILRNARIKIVSFTMRRGGLTGADKSDGDARKGDGTEDCQAKKNGGPQEGAEDRKTRLQTRDTRYRNIDLGRTYDGRFLQRIYAIARAKSILLSCGAETFRADIIIARNLEMLVLAHYVTRKFNPDAVLIYECLDIHRLMTAKGPLGMALRAVERRYLKRVSHIMISSPAFEEEYFRKIQRVSASATQIPIAPGPERVHKKRNRLWGSTARKSISKYSVDIQFILLENKIYAENPGNSQITQRRPLTQPRQAVKTSHTITTSQTVKTSPPAQLQTDTGRPLRLGWFGILRCSRSLSLLSKLAEDFFADIEITLRGKPALDALPGFHDRVNSAENMIYHGPYDAANELAQLYCEMDIIWAGDFSQPGYNSRWLLPNRLYESGAFGVPCCAPADSMTGARIAQLGTGFALTDPIEEGLSHMIRTCLDNPEILPGIRSRILDLPLSNFVDDGQVLANILQQIARSDGSHSGSRRSDSLK